MPIFSLFNGSNKRRRDEKVGLKDIARSLGNSRTPYSLTRGRDIYDICGGRVWWSRWGLLPSSRGFYKPTVLYFSASCFCVWFISEKNQKFDELNNLNYTSQLRNKCLKHLFFLFIWSCDASYWLLCYYITCRIYNYIISISY